MTKYAYYPGCSLHSVAKEYDLSMKAVCRALGIDLIEIPDWICCGSSPAHTTSHLLSLALPISNCIWAENQGLDIIAPCASCFSRLKIANLEIKKDGKIRQKVNRIIEEEYKGTVDILNPLQLFNRMDMHGEIKNLVKIDMSGIKVACYYGCLLSRPGDIAGEDDCEHPKKMDQIITTIGASTCDWQCKTECCGASLAITQPKVAFRLVCEVLNSAMENGADCIAVACPLCQSNLDMRQSEVSDHLGKDIHLPVVYFTQLIGLAIGINQEALGLKHLITAPFSLFEEKCNLSMAIAKG
ncbi:CoB--CoM heterodisulfide reductase iron-sulfur subunit B family protein [bacterium]|nr:CoB--CoM heterodisulfide reductase iron-sulfur subunit B family protein [bacterium]